MMTKPKEVTCIYNSNKHIYKKAGAVCTWSQKEIKPPHLAISMDLYLGLCPDCRNCKAYKKEETKSNNTIKLDAELNESDCANLEMIIRSQIDRNNANMIDCVLTGNKILYNAYKKDNEHIEKLIEKIFKKD